MKRLTQYEQAIMDEHATDAHDTEPDRDCLICLADDEVVWRTHITPMETLEVKLLKSLKNLVYLVRVQKNSRLDGLTSLIIDTTEAQAVIRIASKDKP